MDNIRGNIIVEMAQKEIGIQENPPGSNKQKYGEWFGINGQPWCGMFVSYIYDKSGYLLNLRDFLLGFCNCQRAYLEFMKNKEIVTEPEPGDIVFYDFPPHERMEHCGIFLKKINSLSFIAIEGNTFTIASPYNGIVGIKYRSYTDSIFVHPTKSIKG